MWTSHSGKSSFWSPSMICISYFNITILQSWVGCLSLHSGHFLTCILTKYLHKFDYYQPPFSKNGDNNHFHITSQAGFHPLLAHTHSTSIRVTNKRTKPPRLDKNQFFTEIFMHYMWLRFILASLIEMNSLLVISSKDFKMLEVAILMCYKTGELISLYIGEIQFPKSG